jgi:3-oxoacyl-[acyl-carrier protein] reductase
MNDDLTLSGQIALVTGAGRRRGIGAAIARRLAGAGAAVAFTYYHPYDAAMPWGADRDGPDQLVKAIEERGGTAVSFSPDLSHPAAPERLMAQMLDALGAPTILVNNAAHSVDVAIDDLTPAVLDQHYAVNVRGMALLCAAFIRHYPGPWGRIINLTSGQGQEPMPGNLAYAASKGAVDAFTRSLSAELAAQSITVNAVDPGPTATGWMPDDLAADLVARSPAGRVGRPEDAARLVAFLASPAAAWITGQVIRSRGGL